MQNCFLLCLDSLIGVSLRVKENGEHHRLLFANGDCILMRNEGGVFGKQRGLIIGATTTTAGEWTQLRKFIFRIQLLSRGRKEASFKQCFISWHIIVKGKSVDCRAPIKKHVRLQMIERNVHNFNFRDPNYLPKLVLSAKEFFSQDCFEMIWNIS